MYTSRARKDHQKCLDLLEMISECNNRIGDAQSKLDSYLRKSQLDRYYLFYSETDYRNAVEKYERIKERLVRSYDQQFLAMTTRQVQRQNVAA